MCYSNIKTVELNQNKSKRKVYKGYTEPSGGCYVESFQTVHIKYVQFMYTVGSASGGFMQILHHFI